MGKYQQRFLLRNSYMFDNIIEEVAVDKATAIRDVESDDVPYHAERVAMATKVLRNDRTDDILNRFYRQLKDVAVRTDAFLTEAFKSNKENAEGVPIPDAGDIPDEMLENGISSVWNDVALTAWPTIVEDVAAAEPEPEGEV